MSVSQSAAKYRNINNPGSYTGPWLNSETPYLVEPMDTLSSRLYAAEVFVGPAQSGKTDALILNFAVHSIKVEPMDMVIFAPTNTVARDFSIRRLDRLHNHSTEIGDMLIKRRDADNTFDKKYKNGMLLTLSWPTVNELSGKPVPRVALTDYDRMDDDIGGDGSPFDLAQKRTTTFGSFAMALAESSPSRPVENNMWISSSKHEAPPCNGILGLYNRGDRRRWYWPCPLCNEYFEGEWRYLKWKSLPNILDTADTVWMECPCCKGKILPNDRAEMQEWGVWVKDGQWIDKNTGKLMGEGVRSKIASFWLKGVAAKFTSWSQLVATYLEAQKSFERTGSEEALKKFYNTDVAEPYISKSQEAIRLPEVLMNNADKSYKLGVVPKNSRFLVATVDVQKRSFVVQVFSVLPGDPFDLALVDRFTIHKSRRLDVEGDPFNVSPATYLEDWDLITEMVIKKTYPLEGDPNRHMMVKITGCDSAGRAGSTTNAYNFWRKLKAEGFGGRFILVKGERNPSAPRTKIDYPDSNRRDVNAVARGDVPVLFIQSNQVKDVVANRLECVTPGKGMIRMPDDTPAYVFTELCVEQRTIKGWENLLNHRNEAWDLSYYCLGVCFSDMVKVEKIDWSSPPVWAEVWEKNPYIFILKENESFTPQVRKDYDFASLAKALG